MVALVQVLISIMLIPVAFAAPSVNVGGLTSNHSKSDPTRQLKVSPDGSVEEGLISNVDQETVARNLAFVEMPMCTVVIAVRQHLVCVIPPRLLPSRFSSTR
ncbi:hypothetical protein BASA84_001153 [Batrachochytrium salamandrivorans]|nr:hypothetical protein BASA84_001153 [Batrachochytrium salamandrivorans]